MPNGIHELLVSEIAQKYSPIYPEGKSWQKTVEWLYTEEREFMKNLFESLTTEGFRKPIILSTDEDEEAFVLNGTHRMAIALYHGLVTLPARYGHEEAEYNAKYLYASITLKDSVSMSELEEDKFMDVLRSWRLDAKTWVTSDVCSGAYAQWELFLDQTDLKLKAKLETRIRSILKKVFPTKRFSVTIERGSLE